MLRLAIFILCSSTPAHAALFINGVRVDGIANLKLNNVDVEIDAQGDIHVTAKGYSVNVGEAAKPAPPPPSRGAAQPTKYYLTMSQNGDPQWDVDVYVNGQYVRRFQAGQSSAPIDVTRLVQNGDNKLRFRAVKQEGQPRSTQASELIRLTLDADQALVNGRHELTHIYRYQRTAAETGLFDDAVSFSVR